MQHRRHWVPLILLALLWGCGGAQPDLKPKEYKGRFEDTTQGLSFHCPEKWEVRENVDGHRVIARSPLESKEDSFQENLVVTGPLKGASLEEVQASCEAQLKKLPNYSPKSSSPGILDFDHEGDGLKLHCRAYLEHPQPAGDYWMLSFTSTVADFPLHEKEFEAIMATFGKPLPIDTPSPTPGVSGTPTAAVETTVTPAADPSASPAGTATPAASSTPAPTPVLTPTASPVVSATPAASPTPTVKPTPKPNSKPNPKPH